MTMSNMRNRYLADAVEAVSPQRLLVMLYDRLMAMASSPVVALNRAIAVGQRDGPEHGLAALHAITDVERLSSYPFYPAALAEFEHRLQRDAAAREHLAGAVALARNEPERRFLEQRLRDSFR